MHTLLHVMRQVCDVALPAPCCTVSTTVSTCLAWLGLATPAPLYLTLQVLAPSECELLPLLPRVQAKKPGLPGGSEGAKAIPKGGGQEKEAQGQEAGEAGGERRPGGGGQRGGKNGVMWGRNSR